MNLEPWPGWDKGMDNSDFARDPNSIHWCASDKQTRGILPAWELREGEKGDFGEGNV